MKKKILACLLAVWTMMSTAALADSADWHESRLTGTEVQFAGYIGNYNGYLSADGFGGVAGADDAYVHVISKSASLWSQPSTASKRLASMSFEDTALCAFNGDTPVMQNGFYQVEYKGQSGWVSSAYVVRNELEITLMESNVPAYIAPNSNAKKVGSLSKMTHYRVLGFYDDYYIVSFRGAACAYIPMSCRHYDSLFERLHKQAPTHSGKVNVNTKLRTGPDDSYPEIKEMKAGTSFTCMDEIDGWYMMIYDGKDADGSCYAFIDSDAAWVDWNNDGGEG